METFEIAFYFYASAVTGLHAVEALSEWCSLEEAANEMKHVTAFSDMITGLGGIPSSGYDAEAPFPQLSDPKDIIKYAMKWKQKLWQIMLEEWTLQDASLMMLTPNGWRSS